MRCTRSGRRPGRGKGGDYVLALKGNQGTLHEDVALYLEDPAFAETFQFINDADTGHWRIETRTATVCHDVGWLQERHAWPGLAAIGKVKARREVINGETSTETRYYIMSDTFSPERFLHAVRSQWSIENSLHWVLDVVMNEDRQRNRTGNGPENLGLMRRLALNIALAKPGKRSMRGKLKCAGWSDDVLLDMIRATENPVRLSNVKPK